MGDLIPGFTQPGNFPEYEGADIVLIGVKEDRNAFNNEGCGLAPDFVRRYLYNLFPGAFTVKIVDLGNIKTGFQVSDTYFALSSVIAEMLDKNIVPVIIGGSQDLTYASYQAYESLGRSSTSFPSIPCSTWENRRMNSIRVPTSAASSFTSQLSFQLCQPGLSDLFRGPGSPEADEKPDVRHLSPGALAGKP